MKVKAQVKPLFTFYKIVKNKIPNTTRDFVYGGQVFEVDTESEAYLTQKTKVVLLGGSQGLGMPSPQETNQKVIEAKKAIENAIKGIEISESNGSAAKPAEKQENIKGTEESPDALQGDGRDAVGENVGGDDFGVTVDSGEVPEPVEKTDAEIVADKFGWPIDEVEDKEKLVQLAKDILKIPPSQLKQRSEKKILEKLIKAEK